MERGHYGDDHRAFAELARGFVRKEVAAKYMDYEEAGIVPRSVFARAGELGLLGFAVPQNYGGLGVSGFRAFRRSGDRAASSSTASST